MSKQLATINIDAPINVTLADTLLPEKMRAENCTVPELDFKQMLEQLDSTTQVKEEKEIIINEAFNSFDFSSAQSMDIRIRCFRENYLKMKL